MNLVGFSLIEGEALLFEEGEPLTLTEMITNTAQTWPNKGITYIYDGTKENFQSYRDLFHEALEVLGYLQNAQLKPGDKVIIDITDDKAFFTVFWGCILGGIIPAPLARPSSFMMNAAVFQRFMLVWRLLNKPKIITEASVKKQYQGLLACDEFKGLEVLVREEFTLSPKGRVYQAIPDDIAFLQFSSGSTGSPKGVTLTHRNLLANIKAIIESAGIVENDIICSWLPHTHDMGLIGFHMVPLRLGAEQIKIPPQLFIRKPMYLFKIISEYKATITVSPNFGLNLMLENIKDENLQGINLSSIRLLFNGAEPISTKVMGRFLERFKSFGLKKEAMFPVYGLAEASLAVSFPPPQSEVVIHKLKRPNLSGLNCSDQPRGKVGANAVEFVDVGYPVPGLSVRVVDDCDEVVKEGVIGHIQIKGDCVTQGYYQNEEANANLFVDGWLRTGDLGFIKNKRLTVTGRSKDIIFLHGQNLYAHDLEEIICCVEGITLGDVAVVSFQETKTGGDELCVFVKHKKSLEEFIPIVHKVRKQLGNEMGIKAKYVIPVNKIPKTTSGKIQRFVLRDAFLAGKFQEVVAEIAKKLEGDMAKEVIKPATVLEERILAIWAELLGLSPAQISVEDSFMALGGNSVKALQLLAELEKIVGNELNHDILIKCHTIREIAAYLEELDEKDLFCSRPSIHPQDVSTEPRSSLSRDIAVIGIGLRFPGARSKELFWENLRNGVDLLREINNERKMLVDRPDWNGMMAYLDDVDKFDASFFKIREDEAMYMDPQQRIMLEVAYEALEDGGLITRLKGGENIGVFIGASQVSYQEVIWEYMRKNNIKTLHSLTMVGNMLNMIAARIAHVFNFTGPAITVDTACSSSLVALYYAVESLRARKTKYALVGGANLILTPTTHLLAETAGILAKTNKCRVFDCKADGTVLGEGVGVVLLQPLDEALREGNPIYGVIKGIAINNDGCSLGVMAPNPRGQLNVLRDAYADAQIDPSTVTYLEAHGTGTPIGDPVEIKALTNFFREYTPERQYCGIGSVKSNIGHLLSAAGIAGLIKTILCLAKKERVPSINIDRVNPILKIEETPFFLMREGDKWPVKNGVPRRSGVSSFGFGGTNVHVVLEEAPDHSGAKRRAEGQKNRERDFHILCVSGKTEKSLQENIGQLKEYLASALASQHDPCLLQDICYTRNVYRQHFRYRTAFVASDGKELLNYFNGIPGQVIEKNGMAKERSQPKIAFMFSGQGSQYINMGHDLYWTSSLFAETINHCAEGLKKYLQNGLDIRKILYPETAGELRFAKRMISETWVAQPLIFSVSYALAQFWINLGVKPAFVVGHSIGEYVAACLAGVFSLQDALKLLALRGQLITEYCQSGGLEKAVLPYGPQTVSHSFHSQLGELMLDHFRRVLQEIELSPPQIQFISSIDTDTLLDPADREYWVSHLIKPVNFIKAVAELEKNGCEIFFRNRAGQGPQRFCPSTFEQDGR